MMFQDTQPSRSLTLCSRSVRNVSRTRGIRLVLLAPSGSLRRVLVDKTLVAVRTMKQQLFVLLQATAKNRLCEILKQFANPGTNFPTAPEGGHHPVL